MGGTGAVEGAAVGAAVDAGIVAGDGGSVGGGVEGGGGEVVCGGGVGSGTLRSSLVAQNDEVLNTASVPSHDGNEL